MKQYLDLIKDVLKNGEKRDDRTETGIISVFGRQMRFDLSDGFPIVTTKKIHMKSIIHELLWFISGSTNIKYLKDHNVRIWDEWADDEGNLGRVYGSQWRDWKGVNPKSGEISSTDQLLSLIDNIKKDPFSRRHIISAWQPAEIQEMALPPCHCFIQFYVSNSNKLSCQLYQRSGDIFLGIPFNISSYALFTMMIAQVCNLGLGEFIHTIGDAHIYNNHINQVKEQIKRQPKKKPQIILNKDIKNILDFKFSDFELIGYEPHPLIKGKVSV